MKAKKTSSKKQKSSTKKRLAVYTAAAGAALLAAAPADAAIQYSGVVDVSQWSYMYSGQVKQDGTLAMITLGESNLIDIDGNGIDDLKFWNEPTYLKGWVNNSGSPSQVVVGSWQLNGGFSNLNNVSFAGVSGLASNMNA